MKLGSRGADADTFVSRLRSEGDVAAIAPTSTVEKAPVISNNKE